MPKISHWSLEWIRSHCLTCMVLSENPLHNCNIPNKRIKLSIRANAHIRYKRPRRFFRHIFLNHPLYIPLSLVHKELFLFFFLTRLSSLIRMDVIFAHPVEQLTGDLLECLAGQAHRVTFELVVGHELYDVSFCTLIASAGVEHLVVAVKPVHRAEVGRSNAYYHDGEGQHRGLHDLLYGSIHVADLSVGQDEQDVVLL